MGLINTENKESIRNYLSEICIIFPHFRGNLPSYLSRMAGSRLTWRVPTAVSLESERSLSSEGAPKASQGVRLSWAPRWCIRTASSPSRPLSLAARRWRPSRRYQRSRSWASWGNSGRCPSPLTLAMLLRGSWLRCCLPTYDQNVRQYGDLRGRSTSHHSECILDAILKGLDSLSTVATLKQEFVADFLAGAVRVSNREAPRENCFPRRGKHPLSQHRIESCRQPYNRRNHLCTK